MNRQTTKSASVLSFALFAAIASGAAFAEPGGATLAHNERAAQQAIANTTSLATTVSHETSATLADNERAAQRAIVDATFAGTGSDRATDLATLVQNERAAQRAIVDLPTYPTPNAVAGVALGSAAPAAAR